MTKNKILSAIGIIALIVVGAVVLNAYTDKSRADGSSDLYQSVSDQAQATAKAVKKLGSVSSPDIMSPYFSFGNVKQWAIKTDATVASTTMCRLQAPVATSTLVRTAFKAIMGTSTNLTVAVARTSTANNNSASSTVLATGTLAANAKGDFVYASTTSGSTLGTGQNEGVAGAIFQPSDYVTWTISGGASGINTHVGTGNRIATGTCSVIWQEL